MEQPKDIVSREDMTKFVKDFYGIFDASTFNLGFNVFIPNVYSTLKPIMEYAAKNDLLRGNGLIFDIAGNSFPTRQ